MKHTKLILFLFGVAIIGFYSGVFVRTIDKRDDIEQTQKRRVCVDMVADLFHAGHIEFLKKAKKFGDYLIVGLDSDKDCQSYKRLPILKLEERMKAVGACKYVDKVIGNVPLRVTDEFIDKHKIDVVVHGDDYDETKREYFYGVAIKRGIFKTVSYTDGISTSDIINRVKERTSQNLL